MASISLAHATLVCVGKMLASKCSGGLEISISVARPYTQVVKSRSDGHPVHCLSTLAATDEAEIQYTIAVISVGNKITAKCYVPRVKDCFKDWRLFEYIHDASIGITHCALADRTKNFKMPRPHCPSLSDTESPWHLLLIRICLPTSKFAIMLIPYLAHMPCPFYNG